MLYFSILEPLTKNICLCWGQKKTVCPTAKQGLQLQAEHLPGGPVPRLRNGRVIAFQKKQLKVT